MIKRLFHGFVKTSASAMYSPPSNLSTVPLTIPPHHCSPCYSYFPSWINVPFRATPRLLGPRLIPCQVRLSLSLCLLHRRLILYRHTSAWSICPPVPLDPSLVIIPSQREILHDDRVRSPTWLISPVEWLIRRSLPLLARGRLDTRSSCLFCLVALVVGLVLCAFACHA